MKRKLNNIRFNGICIVFIKISPSNSVKRSLFTNPTYNKISSIPISSQILFWLEIGIEDILLKVGFVNNDLLLTFIMGFVYLIIKTITDS